MKQIIIDACGVCGLGSIGYGLYLINLSLALVIVGVILMVGAYALSAKQPS